MIMINPREESHHPSVLPTTDPSVTVNGQSTPVRPDRVKRAQMFIQLGKMDTDLRVDRALDRILEDFEQKLQGDFEDPDPDGR